MYKLILPFLIFLSFTSFSQSPLDPVHWTTSYSDLPNGEGEILIKAKIDPKWHIYSQRPTDAGPIPTSFTITANAGFVLVGKVEENNAHEEFVAAFDAKVFVFETEAIFKQKIKRKNKAGSSVKVTLEYMTCNDKQCLPPKIIELQANIPAKK